MNILLLGVDKAHGETDAVILISLNPGKNVIKVLPISSKTKTTVHGANVPISSVYSVGGIDMTIEKVTQIVPVPVDHYIFANIESFKKIIDNLGSVEFDVPFDMYYEDKSQNLLIDLKKGMQTLNGEQAEKLVRYIPSPPHLEGRLDLQSEFLKAVISQKLSKNFPENMPEILKEAINTTNTDFTAYNVLDYIKILNTLADAKIEVLSLKGHYEYINDLLFFIADEEYAAKILK